MCIVPENRWWMTCLSRENGCNYKFPFQSPRRRRFSELEMNKSESMPFRLVTVLSQHSSAPRRRRALDKNVPASHSERMSPFKFTVTIPPLPRPGIIEGPLPGPECHGRRHVTPE
jgi:hypothetical protein